MLKLLTVAVPSCKAKKVSQRSKAKLERKGFLVYRMHRTEVVEVLRSLRCCKRSAAGPRESCVTLTYLLYRCTLLSAQATRSPSPSFTSGRLTIFDLRRDLLSAASRTVACRRLQSACSRLVCACRMRFSWTTAHSERCVRCGSSCSIGMPKAVNACPSYADLTLRSASATRYCFKYSAFVRTICGSLSGNGMSG